MPRGQRQTRQPQVEGKLSNSLVLNRYILSLFGATSLEALSEHLKDPALEGWDENNVSYFHKELLQRLFATSELTEEMLFPVPQPTVYGNISRQIFQRQEETA